MLDLSTLKLTDTPEGCRLRLRVRPGARRDEIVGAHGEALKIAVSALPERGRANRAVLELLAKSLGLPASRLRLAAGETSPDKTVLIQGISGEEMRRRLESLPPASPTGSTRSEK
jgi:hypothetical protein